MMKSNESVEEECIEDRNNTTTKVVTIEAEDMMGGIIGTTTRPTTKGTTITMAIRLTIISPRIRIILEGTISEGTTMEEDEDTTMEAEATIEEDVPTIMEEAEVLTAIVIMVITINNKMVVRTITDQMNNPICIIIIAIRLTIEK